MQYDYYSELWFYPLSDFWLTLLINTRLCHTLHTFHYYRICMLWLQHIHR